MEKPSKRLLDWQRKLDPSNFNKKTGAKYHTAPSVVFPGSPNYPKGAPDESVTIMFYFDGKDWLAEYENVSLDDPTFIEKKPRTKKTKHGPVVALSETAALCVIPVSENYYWSAWVLSQHRVLQASFKLGRPQRDGTPKQVVCVATFMPNDGEE